MVKNYLIITALILGSFFLFQCSQNLKNRTITKSTKDYTEFLIDSLVIESDALNFSHAQYFSYKDKESLILLNKSSNKLEEYDLSTGDLIYSQKIAGVSNTKKVKSFFKKNSDSLFVMTNNFIYILNSEEKIDSIAINTDKNYFDSISFTSRSHYELYFDQKRNKLSVMSYCWSCSQGSQEYFEFPQGSSYDLIQDTFSPVAIHYHPMYIEKYYGFHMEVYRSEYDDIILYGISAEPTISVINKSNSKTKRIDSRSSFQLREINELKRDYIDDSNKKFKHFTLEPFYSSVLYDSKNKNYLRFYYDAIPEKNPDGTYNEFSDKNMSIVIINSITEEKSEINFGVGKYFDSFSFYGRKGLYIKRASSNSKKLVYDIFSI